MRLTVQICLMMLSCMLIGACGNRDAGDEAPEYMLRIKAARTQIAPMEESLLQKVTEQYNIEVDGVWPEWAERCLTYQNEFEDVERLTLYPAAFVAGFAMHESAGCKMSASDWAGGKGFMQLTHISKSRHVDPIARMLHLERGEVDYRHNPLHNLLVGIAVLDDYERQLGSRPHGILAYNMGTGCKTSRCLRPHAGVRGIVRKMGKSTNELPEIVQMKPHLRYDRRMKPRTYVQNIAAAVITMDRALRGEPIERQESRFEPSDMPGFYPAKDGDNVLESYDD